MRGTAPQCAGALLYPPNLPTGGYNPTLLAQYNGMLNFINYQATQPFYDIFDDQTTKHDATLRLLVNRTSWTINDGLSLVNIAGYNNVWSRDKNDGVGSPFALLPISPYPGPNSEGHTFSTKQYSDELHLAGKALGTRFNYLLGAYFLRDFEGENIPLNVGCGSIAFAAVPVAVRFRAAFATTSKTMNCRERCSHRRTTSSSRMARHGRISRDLGGCALPLCPWQ